ncbi:hypothetical protein N9D31_01370 [Oligoflexaceae bacterium]|nr:hypothetical protein [Oligoflexaceae bacterium]
MKRKLIWQVTVLTAGLWSCQAMAVPYASLKCNPLKAKIVHPDGAQGVLFDESCSTAYVLPPETGNAGMSAIAGNSNLNFCSSVNKIPELSKTMVDSLDSVGQKVLAMIKDFEPQNAQLQELREKTDDLNADFELLKSRHEALEIEEGDLKQSYISSKNDYNDCLELNEDKPEICDVKKTEMNVAKTEWAGMKKGEYKEVSRSLLAKKNELDKAGRKLARFTGDLTKNLSPLFDLQEKLFTLKDKLSELYTEYAPLRGVTGQITYEVNWSEILNKYQELNPDVTLNFVKMPIIDAKVHATAYVDRENAQAGIPVLLHAAIPGLGEMGIEQIGSGDLSVEPETSVPDEVASVALGLGDAAVSGQMTLSLVGACPFFPEGSESDRDEISSDDLTAYMTVNAVYEFPLKARRKYKAEYQLARMMERIEKKKKKGGFFSSKSVHEVIENSDSKDWFKITFDANDPDFSYTSAEQDAITAEVKIGLIQRALGHVAATTFQAGGNPPPLPDVMPNGASVTGDALNKTCGFHIYCRAGGFVLKALSSIFGRSEAVSSFKRSNDVWVEDQVNQVSVMRRQTSLTFTAK